jgi:four helix bundle protein
MNALDKADALKERTKQFAIRIVAVSRSLPRSREADVVAKQLLRSGTAVAANYRAVCRARSKAEFISKMGIVVEETDETVFWLELLGDTGLAPAAKLALLLKEANELVAICAASLRTAKYNNSAA